MRKKERRHKRAVFLCQLGENMLKVAKCLYLAPTKREFTALETEPIAPDIDQRSLSEKLSQVFKKLEYNHNLVIVSLPRQQATSRYIKVPAQLPEEIEKIIQFQAPKYLPYPIDELITAYQTILTDKAGYSQLNLFIVHQDIIARYLDIFKAIGVKNFLITVSSSGLFNLYNYLQPKEMQATLLVDIDSDQTELLIAAQKKMLFSRSFRVLQPERLLNQLVEEIKKSSTVYLKENQDKPITQIVIFSANPKIENLLETLSGQVGVPVRFLPYAYPAGCAENFLNQLAQTDVSFVSLIGLGLKEIPASLVLLPQSIKAADKKARQRKVQLRLGLLILGSILIFSLGIAKNLDNKAKYLKFLRGKLAKIENETRALEQFEKRFNRLSMRAQKETSLLDILSELHRITPQDVSLNSLNYTENEEVSLHGQTAQLNSVFSLVLELEKSQPLKNFKVKVKYATKKRMQAGELVDFEIICKK